MPVPGEDSSVASSDSDVVVAVTCSRHRGEAVVEIELGGHANQLTLTEERAFQGKTRLLEPHCAVLTAPDLDITVGSKTPFTAGF